MMEISSDPEESSTSVYYTASSWVNVERALSIFSVLCTLREDNSESLMLIYIYLTQYKMNLFTIYESLRECIWNHVWLVGFQKWNT